MCIQLFLDTFKKEDNITAIIWNNCSYSYKFLLDSIENYYNLLNSNGILEGAVVVIYGDFSPNCIAVLFSLIKNKCIIIPLNNQKNKENSLQYEISKPEYLLSFDGDDNLEIKKLIYRSENTYYKLIREQKDSGLVLFSSGTSGQPKAAVHRFSLLLDKFKSNGKALRTLNFLLFDHWGGLNTMFKILSNSGCIITTKDRSPLNICKLIQEHNIELLPASPTFLNLLLLSEVYKDFDLSCLKMITYGTEPMHQHTLKKLVKTFPNIKFLQTYGLIEIGVLKSISEKNDSLWIKIDGKGYQTRIVDGILQIKSKSTMLGYLNYRSPITDDGWFITGDKVIQKGDYIKILGRQSDIINIGGEKVFPQEIENTILEMESVSDVTVASEKNSIIGNIITAKIVLIKNEEKKSFIKKLKKHCRERLDKFKLPVKIQIVNEELFNDRFKKKRFNI